MAFWDADLEAQRAVVRRVAIVQLTRAAHGARPPETLTDPHGRNVRLTLDVDTVEVEMKK